jgi:hypothetical protein
MFELRQQWPCRRGNVDGDILVWWFDCGEFMHRVCDCSCLLWGSALSTSIGSGADKAKRQRQKEGTRLRKDGGHGYFPGPLFI